jgi:hypothetical protein
MHNLLNQIADHMPNRLHFLFDGSPLSVVALTVLAVTAGAYLISRNREWLWIFCTVSLYLVPFIIRGY